MNNNQIDSPAVQDLNIEMSGSEEAKLAAFVGEKKKDYYLRKWQKDNSWNWAAFFLTLIWLGYRKMYRPIFYVLIAFIAVDLVVILLGIESNVIDNSIGFALSGALGVGGNLLYKKHAQKETEAVERLSIREEEKLHELRKRGGTSGMGAFIGVLLFVGYILFSMILFSIAS